MEKYNTVYMRHYRAGRPYLKDSQREYKRRYYVGGIRVSGKRNRTINCEICGKMVSYLAYHHWNDNHPEIGIWVCASCHRVVEGIDRGYYTIYLALKVVIQDDV